MSRLVRALCAASATAVACPDFAFAQAPSSTAATPLPTIVIQGTRPRPPRRAPERTTAPATPAQNTAPQPAQPTSLTVPTTEQAVQAIQRTPGGVAVVPDTAFKNSPAQTHQGRPRLGAGRLGAAEMGRRHAPLDPRLGPVAQFPPARHPALHGRHPDQHGGRLRRFPGDRPDRLSLRRGLQGRERAALRRQLARRRDQLRDADRPRCAAGSTARIDAGSFGYLQGAGRLGRRLRPVRLLRHRVGAALRRLPRSQRGHCRARQRELRLPALAGRRDALLRQRQHGAATHPGRGDEDLGAEFAARRPRPATSLLDQQRNIDTRARRQQDDACASGRRRWTSASSASIAT